MSLSSRNIQDMSMRLHFTRTVLLLMALLTEGSIVSGGQDKLIYVHKPGDSQPSHVLVGHESNVLPL